MLAWYVIHCLTPNMYIRAALSSLEVFEIQEEANASEVK